MTDKKLLNQVIKLAYEQPEIRTQLLPLIKEASFMTEWGDRKIKNPLTGNEIKVKSLKSTNPEHKKILDQLREEYRNSKTEPSAKDPKKRPFTKKVKLPYEHKRTPVEIEQKYGLTEEDEEELYKKGFRRAKTTGETPRKTIEEIKRDFLKKAKPETRERMKKMSLEDFEAMFYAVVEDEEI